MERLVLGFSAFFAMFLGMFDEDRLADDTGQIKLYGKAVLESD